MFRKKNTDEIFFQGFKMLMKKFTKAKNINEKFYDD